MGSRLPLLSATFHLSFIPDCPLDFKLQHQMDPGITAWGQRSFNQFPWLHKAKSLCIHVLVVLLLWPWLTHPHTHAKLTHASHLPQKSMASSPSSNSQDLPRSLSFSSLMTTLLKALKLLRLSTGLKKKKKKAPPFRLASFHEVICQCVLKFSKMSLSAPSAYSTFKIWKKWSWIYTKDYQVSLIYNSKILGKY